jgi:hypothetical protein
LGNIGKYWEILGNIGKYWEILGNIGKYWEILGKQFGKIENSWLYITCRKIPL